MGVTLYQEDWQGKSQTVRIRSGGRKRAKLKPDAQHKHQTDIGLTLTREPRKNEAVEHILCKVSL